jgi:hypothetical protein
MLAAVVVADITVLIEQPALYTFSENLIFRARA